MKPLTIILALSLMANAMLAAWWLQTPSSHQHTSPNVPTLTNLVAASAPGTFSWSDLETDDLKEFLRRLRAVGCPEETTRDLVLDEVDRRYGLKKRVLWPERKNPPPFWKAEKRDAATQKLNREKQRQNRALEREKSALVIELFSGDPRPERRRAEGLEDDPPWQDARVAFLPGSKRDAVARYLDECEEELQAFYAENQGLHDAQYRAGLKKLEAYRFLGLAELLTPTELREFELRHSLLAGQLALELRNQPSLTRDQYEAIYDIRKKYGDRIHQFEDEPNPLAEANQKALQAEIAAVLGPDLAKRYRRSLDPSFVQLTRLVARKNLPDSTATRIYEMKEAAEARLGLLKNDQSLTPQQRQQVARQISTEIIYTIQSILGDAHYQRYLRNGGGWLVGLAAAPSSPQAAD